MLACASAHSSLWGYMCIWRPEVLVGGRPWSLFHLIRRGRVSLPSPERTNVAHLDVSFWGFPPIFWDWNCRQTGYDTLAFKWVPEIWTPVFTCARQALNQGAISSASCLEKSMLLKTTLAHPTDTIILLVKMSVLCKQNELWMCVNFINNHEVHRCTRLKIKDTSPRSKGTNVPTVLLDIHFQEPKIWGKEPLRACKDQSP